ncbi:MAG: indole-3-glycerol phosphate synthase TrpC [Halorhodospira sp.]
MSGAGEGAPDVLRRILRRKAEEVVERAEAYPLRELSAAAADLPPARGFGEALARRVARGSAGVIAELKRASPSRGVIREGYDPAAVAADYERHGAACLSVLTDRDFFRGDDAHLQAAREAVRLPVLRKDFTVDAYQVYEARVLGADCILLIAAALGDAQLDELHALALELGMDALIEVHDAEELARARRLGPALVGVNNRDLRTFETDLSTSEALAEAMPEGALAVSESGIHSSAEVARLRAAGIHAFLVGEAFMAAPSPGARLPELFGDLGAPG